MLKNVRMLGLAVVAGMGLAGCQPKEVGKSGPGVIDLDRVAVALGWDGYIKDSLADKDQLLSDRVNQAKVSLEAQLEEFRSQLGETPSQEQLVQLQQLAQQANMQLQNQLNTARQESADYRASLVNEFREKVRPHVERIGKESGFAVVVLKADPVYVVQSEAEISGKVIEALQTAGVKPPVRQ